MPKYGALGNSFPFVPGHEGRNPISITISAAGIIDVVGPKVPDLFQAGDAVGVGWFGGSCGVCDVCRDGDLLRCQQSKVNV